MIKGAKKFGGVTLLEAKRNGAYPHCHTLYVEDGEGLLVDPACRREQLEAVRDNGGAGVIINSHAHVDHVLFNSMFPGSEVWAHEADAPAIESPEEMRARGMKEKFPKEISEAQTSMLREKYGYRGTRVTRFLRDGEELRIGGTLIRIIHSPGHTPGHIFVHFPEIRLLFLGDITFTQFGPWYGCRVANIDDLLASIDRAVGIDADWYVPAHGGPVYDDIKGLAKEYSGVVLRREAEILDAIGGGATLDELADKKLIYRKSSAPEAVARAVEKSVMIKHLERLEAAGRVALDGDRYVKL